MWLAALPSKAPAGGRKSSPHPLGSSASRGQPEDTPGVREQEEQVPGRGPGAGVREEAWATSSLSFQGAHHPGAGDAPTVKGAVMGVAQDASREAAAGPSGRAVRKRWELG